MKLYRRPSSTCTRSEENICTSQGVVLILFIFAISDQSRSDLRAQSRLRVSIQIIRPSVMQKVTTFLQGGAKREVGSKEKSRENHGAC